MSILNGYTLGGGVGAGIYCTYRIATEKAVFSMPEARLGFINDVGSSYFLSKVRNNLGLYSVLTGTRFTGK